MQKIRKKNRAKITKKNKFITYIQKRIYAKRWDLMKMQKQKYIYIMNFLAQKKRTQELKSRRKKKQNNNSR